MLIGLAVLGMLGLIAVGALVIGAKWLSDNVDEVFGGDCTLVTKERASQLFGKDVEVFGLGAVTDAVVGLALDKRALDGETSCVVNGSKDTFVARVARYTGTDAARKFRADRARANPQTEDRGGGLSVTREGWFGYAVDGIGDEAFCTTADLAGAVGVLARRGDTVVYVSITDVAVVASAGGDLQATADGKVISRSSCDRAAAVARVLLSR
ncbi:MAG: hypothetical protein ACKO91_10185 [Acidimicrobiales bacterium]